MACEGVRAPCVLASRQGLKFMICENCFGNGFFRVVELESEKIMQCEECDSNGEINEREG